MLLIINIYSSCRKEASSRREKFLFNKGFVFMGAFTTRVTLLFLSFCLEIQSLLNFVPKSLLKQSHVNQISSKHFQVTSTTSAPHQCSLILASSLAIQCWIFHFQFLTHPRTVDELLFLPKSSFTYAFGIKTGFNGISIRFSSYF